MRLFQNETANEQRAMDRSLLSPRTITFEHTSSKALYDYWNALRRTRRAPLRSEVDPTALGPILSTMIVLERVDSEHALFRIAGTSICAAFGRELRDQNFLALWDAKSRPHVRDLIARCTAEGETAVIRLEAVVLNRRSLSGEIILLPLTDERGRFTRLIGTLAASEPLHALGRHHVVRFELCKAHLIDPRIDRALLTPGRFAQHIRPRLRLVADRLAGPSAARLDRPWSRSVRDQLKSDD